ncbi:site-specific integrase [Vibrio jasicida]|uniref:site-specific integrase n=1 Tax=Vibrio jasicida TaxID=766224 RepID=UPI0005EE16FF|nr:site-specific integrase [Vibrio jasicida]
MKNKALPKLPKGLSWRKYASGNLAIQISFTYKGISCREVLKNLTNTKADINYATNLYGKIQAEIARNTFKYADYFPESKMLEKFGEAKSNATLDEYIGKYIVTCIKRDLSPFTIDKKQRNREYISTCLKNKLVTQITTKDIKDYFEKLTLSFGSAKIQLELIRNALEEAKIDTLIPENPCERFKLTKYVSTNQRKNNTSDRADPFDLFEVHKILSMAYKRDLSIGNAIQLWMNTGLRTGEFLGLTWDCVDLKNRKLYIKQSMVKGELRQELKNKFAFREVPLNDAALEALERQKPLSYFQQSFLFANIKSLSFKNHGAFVENIWLKLLERAEVRYRRPYNCRHTYATMHISSGNYVNIWKLAKWMGHQSPSMLEKHYGDFLELYESIDSNQGLSLSNIPNLHVQNTCKC